MKKYGENFMLVSSTEVFSHLAAPLRMEIQLVAWGLSSKPTGVIFVTFLFFYIFYLLFNLSFLL